MSLASTYVWRTRAAPVEVGTTSPPPCRGPEPASAKQADGPTSRGEASSGKQANGGGGFGTIWGGGNDTWSGGIFTVSILRHTRFFDKNSQPAAPGFYLKQAPYRCKWFSLPSDAPTH